ncbi:MULTISPECIES: hypothetical protein [Thermomonosporaceae]|uniref:hypothetical protein n=1 Tax=Thermomonosporaceae TaxID=2012 RepID=UPI00255B1BE1|nr:MULTISPECIES: hypothetical protein [Thermomonosporaceae]MDL4772838.1 hypothetical protein [Actinomadura xylanilytica]
MPADPTGAPPTVYLHIGAPKSGTTFLQGLLWHNAGTLREHGVLMPGGSFAAQVRATRDLRGLVREPDDPAPDWTGAWDLIASRIKESDARVAVVSNEVISAADAEQAGRAVRSLEPAEVHVVYSARDLAGLLPSEWQEYVKHRFHYDFGHWLGEVVDGPPDDAAAAWFWRVHDIPEVLARWSAHVPPERVHVLTMPRPGAPRELLWERFAGLIGVDPAIADLSEARANAALSWTETELLRRINGAAREDAPMWLYHRLVTDVLALRVLPGQGAPGRVPLPGDRRDWAATRARELVESIRSAGYDVVGDLDELLPGDAVPDAAPPADGALVDAAAHTILALLDRISMLREDVGELRRQRAEQERTALPKLMARHLSERNQAVWKMRVGYWHMVERIKGIEPPPLPEPAAPASASGGEAPADVATGTDGQDGEGAGEAPADEAARPTLSSRTTVR